MVTSPVGNVMTPFTICRNSVSAVVVVVILFTNPDLTAKRIVLPTNVDIVKVDIPAAAV